MSPSRRHERHGRSPLVFRAPVPAQRTRAEAFAHVAAQLFADIRARVNGELADVVLTIDDVPPADAGLELGRVVQPSPAAAPILVLHRLPIADRCRDEADLADLLAEVLAEQAALLCGRDPDDLLPR